MLKYSLKSWIGEIRLSRKKILLFGLSLILIQSFIVLIFIGGSQAILKQYHEDNMTTETDVEYANTIAGLIYRQELKNCIYTYEIEVLKGTDKDLLIEDLEDCKQIVELALSVLENLKENPHIYDGMFDEDV